MKLILLSLLSFSSLVMAETITLANINLEYSDFGFSAGEGKVLLTHNEKNEITKVTLDVAGGFLFEKEYFMKTLSLDDIKKGKTIEYYPGDADMPLLKIKALKGFDKDGGLVKVLFRKNGGYEPQVLEIVREDRSKRFCLWRNNHIVRAMNINLLGFGLDELYVNWFAYQFLF